ncbi:unnamed protein product [Microthlaspi erraticum]|uniref:Integrase catalytic domain-containing protein n=1 Tax=Microthlaspi erraticum TaxID=1685480 RepID=A0A6D2JT04_9BRAS|nr:unnamed protein product [Microthlaspi erraticum]
MVCLEVHSSGGSRGILEHCHGSSYGGHFATFKTLPRFFKPDSGGQAFSKTLTTSLQGIHPVAVDYVSKWVEAIASPTNDAKVVLKLFKSIIFPRYGVPRVVISDGGSHFINKVFENLLKKYGVKHKVATPYHPQTSGQVEVSNKQIKGILRTIVGVTKKDWAVKLDDALWAYRTAYKTPIGRTPFSLLYGKSCHLPVEIEYRALGQSNCSTSTSERTKAFHDKKIVPKSSRLENMRCFSTRELSCSLGSSSPSGRARLRLRNVLPYGAVTLLNQNGEEFTVNGHKLKPYLGQRIQGEGVSTPLPDAP